MKRIVPIIIVICVVLGIKFYNKSKAGREIKAQAVEQIDRSLPEGMDMDYVHELIDHAHPLAMDKAYKMGGRRTADDFDGQAYRSELYKQMGLKAQAEGKSVLATIFLAEAGIHVSY